MSGINHGMRQTFFAVLISQSRFQENYYQRNNLNFDFCFKTSRKADGLAQIWQSLPIPSIITIWPLCLERLALTFGLVR